MRNIDHAFDRGYQEFLAGCKTWQNPYQARYARNAWRAGWEKAKEQSEAVTAAPVAVSHS